MKSKKPLPRILITAIAVLLILLNRYALPRNAQQERQAPVQAAQQSTQEVGSESVEAEDSELYWGNLNTLQDHFDRHGADFGAADPEDYARQAYAFYLERARHQVKDDDGTLRVFDADTNAFGAYNRDGTAKTYFKPDDGQAYFDRQPGKLLK